LRNQGGYKLGRASSQITVDDILWIAENIEETGPSSHSSSALLKQVIEPALTRAEAAFSEVLARTTIEDLTRSAVALRK